MLTYFIKRKAKLFRKLSVSNSLDCIDFSERYNVAVVFSWTSIIMSVVNDVSSTLCLGKKRPKCFL